MPSQAMRSAVKQITKLHESLTLVLPETQVEVNVFALSLVSRAIVKKYIYVICRLGGPYSEKL